MAAGDEEYENPEQQVEDGLGSLTYVKKFKSDPDPLEFEEFKETIDTRGGYQQEVAPQFILEETYRPSCVSGMFSEGVRRREASKQVGARDRDPIHQRGKRLTRAARLLAAVYALARTAQR